MAPRSAPAWLLGVLVLAGCLQGAPPTATDGPTTDAWLVEWAERAVEAGPDHDHRDPLQHAGRSTPNFEVLGWNPLITDYHGTTSAGHLCGDTATRDGRTLTVVHSWVSDVSLIVIDTTDPADPQKIGELILPYTHVYDLAITPDQRSVLLATTTDTGPDDAALVAGLPRGPAIQFRDACTGQTHPVTGPEQDLPYWLGLVLIDITDPRQPAVQDYLFLGGGHSIQVAQLDGRNLVLVTTPTFSIIEVVDAPDGRHLVPVTPRPYGQCGRLDAAGAQCGYHDGYLQKHPVTGQNLAYLATTSALVLFDIGEPRLPQMVGRWDDWAALGPAAPSNPFLHGVLPMDELWDGRHYTFVHEECGPRAATPTCLAFVLDTTDPARPTIVGAWTVPVELEFTGSLLFSLHYAAVINRTLFVSNYHGGVWAVDVSDLGSQFSLPTIGVFIPDHVSPQPVGRRVAYDWAPAVLDVLPQPDGNLIVFDHTSGIYSVRFDASNPMPSPTPWPLGVS